MPAVRNLIFDLGLFDGSDSAFYLSKGFRVVAIEARPDLCAAARLRFANEIASGQFSLVDRAIWTAENERIPFYSRDGWSSIFRSSAERDGGASETIEVTTTTMARLFEQFGIPHFLKCDIEAAEFMVVDAIGRAPTRPTFVSVEDPTGQMAARLHAIGYDRFQMVNQGHLDDVRQPKSSREGNSVQARFDGKCSGLFGHDLNPKYWFNISKITAQMNYWNRLRDKQVNPLVEFACRRLGKLTGRGWLVPGGWADIHATTASNVE